MKIPFVTDSIRGRLPVNLYPVKDDERGSILVGTPGKPLWCDLGATYTRVRGACRMGDYLYVVVSGLLGGTGSTFFQITTAGTATVKGTMPGSSGSECWVIGNGSQVWVSDGAEAWLYTVDSEFTRTVTSLTSAGTTCTAICEDHGFADASAVVMSGATQVEYNGTFTITRISDDSFSYTALSTPSAVTATGTSILATQTVTDKWVKARDDDPDFPGSGASGFLDGYIVFLEPDTGRIWITGINDAGMIDGLDYATAEGLPDNNVSLLIDHREVWAFGEISTEVLYNSGNADFPLERVSGAFVEHGCISSMCPAKQDNTVFWVTDKGQVVRAEGYQPQIISTRKIDRIIASFPDKTDIVGLAYTVLGQAFYKITSPSAKKSLVYNAATQAWHEESSLSPLSGEFEHERSTCYAYFAGKHLVGDHYTGKIYEYDPDTYSEAGSAIKRIVTSQEIQQERKTLFHSRVEVEFETGVALSTGQGSDPQAVLRYSDDGGHTWSDELWRDMGLIGEYKARCVWERLGSSRNRVYEVSVTDPIDVTILGAYTEIQAGTH